MKNLYNLLYDPASPKNRCTHTPCQRSISPIFSALYQGPSRSSYPLSFFSKYDTNPGTWVLRFPCDPRYPVVVLADLIEPPAAVPVLAGLTLPPSLPPPLLGILLGASYPSPLHGCERSSANMDVSLVVSDQ